MYLVICSSAEQASRSSKISFLATIYFFNISVKKMLLISMKCADTRYCKKPGGNIIL